MDLVKKTIVEEYWLKKLSGKVPEISLPSAVNHREEAPPPLTRHAEPLQIDIPTPIHDKLKKVAKNSDIAVFILFLSALNIVLHRYTGVEDLVVGTLTPAGAGTGNDIVFCRNRLSHHRTVREVIGETRREVLETVNYGGYLLDDVLAQLRAKNTADTLNTLNIFSAACIYEPFQEKNDSLRRFDLVCILSAPGARCTLQVEYPLSSRWRGIAGKFARNLIVALDGMPGHLDQEISTLDIVGPEEKELLLHDFNNTRAAYPADRTIHRLFEEQVEMNPHRAAVIFEDRTLTYEPLNKNAHRLAAHLKEKGVRQETIVGLLMDRSIEMIVGILGTLKAGGAYLPIDPGYPADRISYTLKDSGTRILLTLPAPPAELEYNGETIVMEAGAMYPPGNGNPGGTGHSANTAYIIYTSGTTGRPKGVMVEHWNVVRLLFNDRFQFDFSRRDVWTMFHSYCFDFSVWEMYGALLFGAKLIVIPKTAALDTRQYLLVLKKHGVTILNQTPSAFYHLVEEELDCPDRALHLRYVIFGGEALKPGRLSAWKLKYPETKPVNMFGITETTVHVTYKEITDEDIEQNISNIGRPIPTLTTYVLDRHLKLLPLGAAGELCVGGAGVGRGYLNRQALTGERFLQDPFRNGERLYRSGDLVRLLENGEMEYLGRIDHQVKIRGFRVELGEIENQLMRHEEIKEAVVLLEEAHLYAYIVAGAELNAAQLREFLSGQLPDHMIPSYFRQVKKIPLTSNGKVDRKTLTILGKQVDTGTAYVAPRDEIEQKVAGIWQEVLNLEKVGIYDNYFELGGTSFDIIRINRKLKEVFLEDIPVVTMFRYTTVHSLAAYLNRDRETETGIRDRATELERGKRDRLQRQRLRKREGVGNG